MIGAYRGFLPRRINVKNGQHHGKVLFNFCRSELQSKFFSGSKSLSRAEERGSGISSDERQMPTLIHIRNPITWLINKIDFKMLKAAWDPDFNENEFRAGTIQAVSVICTLISKNMWDNLRGLLTRQALTRLQKDVELNWSDIQRRNIFMEPSDVKLALPRKIHFIKIAEKKFVDVDMMFVAMKFKELEPSTNNEIFLIELVARFHRNYTDGEIPNWTVTLFKVTRFHDAVANT